MWLRGGSRGNFRGAGNRGLGGGANRGLLTEKKGLGRWCS